MPLIDPQLRALLICPACRGELDENAEKASLDCLNCGRVYPVHEFPVMLLEEKASLEEGALPAGE